MCIESALFYSSNTSYSNNQSSKFTRLGKKEQKQKQSKAKNNKVRRLQ